MDPYKNYSEEDFLLDDLFRRWVFESKQADEVFWTDWLNKNPDKQELINHVKDILLVLKENQPTISKNEIKKEVQHFLSTIRGKEEKKYNGVSDFSRFKIRIPFQWVAACVLLAMSWGYYEYFKKPFVANSYYQLVDASVIPLLETVNHTDKKIKVTLSDGSMITLEKNSRISYPKTFPNDKREVYLVGEAFFEVAKNPDKPFFVHSNELITKVLGTSFNIRAYETDKKIWVSVKTGRVSVFTQQESENKSKEDDFRSRILVLMPNQEAIYSREHAQLNKGIVENPALLGSISQKPSFVFENTPVNEVLSMLEETYGVHIIYDEQLISTCVIRADLTDETLYEKMDLISKIINGSYKVVDGQIIISAKGCSS